MLSCNAVLTVQNPTDVCKEACARPSPSTDFILSIMGKGVLGGNWKMWSDDIAILLVIGKSNTCQG